MVIPANLYIDKDFMTKKKNIYRIASKKHEKLINSHITRLVTS